jgi:NAD(P)-dependent dehydrogenase (short-subunit alcohol dehydrogenase family)
MKPNMLNGTVVAITGAARGIGLATAKELHRRGAKVMIGDIDADLAEFAAASLGPSGAACRLDVTDEESFASFLANAEREFGSVDVLINNAGIMPIGHFEQQSPSLTRRAVEINLLGPLIGMKSVLPSMLTRGRGHIINVASTAGKAAVPGGLTYCATKSGVVALTETARIEYAGSGLSFTCVMPSFTNTELITGTKGTRGVKTIEPGDVAVAIAKTIVRPRPDVYVPAMVGPLLRMQSVMGRRMRNRVNRSMGVHDTFLDFDAAVRSAYDNRIEKD